jgi:signal transduction histidine kinase
MLDWVGAVFWLSAGLYGYLIIHHALQAFLSRERVPNLWLVGFLCCSLAFSFVDAWMYRPTADPPCYAHAGAIGQFVLSALCATLFVQMLNQMLHLSFTPLVRGLWAITVPLPAFAALNRIVLPDFEARPMLLGGYYIQGVSTPLGTAYSLVYLSAFLATFVAAYVRWRQHSPQDKLMLVALSLSVPLIVVDMMVYYGILAFVSTWNYAFWVISVALSIRLNAQLYQLTRELRQANHDLQEAYRQMVEQERLSAIGQVVRGIVHDLKNFFNNVQLCAGAGILHAANDPNFDATRYFENICKATEQAHQYLIDLLTMTRADAELELAEVAPSAIVEEVERLSGARLIHPPITLVNNIPTHLCMRADRRYLMQLFLNLTLNAIQAMRDWQGERRIEYDWVEHPEQTILVIRDTGPGMPPEVRDYLFERAVTTRPNGNGIGLMLAQSAMQKHNGTIEVRSEQGQGTTFVCIFPSPPTREARA